MTFLDRLERRFGHMAIRNLTAYIIAGQVLAWALAMTRPQLLWDLRFVAALVWQGEVWRIFTFLFIPPDAHFIFLAFAWYIFWMMGGALEREWGVFKYNLYILVWALASMAAGHLFPFAPVDNSYLMLSVFLGFAYRFPNFELLLFFVLPVKMKWLGWLGGGMALLTLLLGPLPAKALVLAGLLNFGLFFGPEFLRTLGAARRRAQRRSEAAEAEGTPFHECVQCGATDQSHPDRDFRYREEGALCSACLERERAAGGAAERGEGGGRRSEN